MLFPIVSVPFDWVKFANWALGALGLEGLSGGQRQLLQPLNALSELSVSYDPDCSTLLENLVTTTALDNGYLFAANHFPMLFSRLRRQEKHVGIEFAPKVYLGAEFHTENAMSEVVVVQYNLSVKFFEIGVRQLRSRNSTAGPLAQKTSTPSGSFLGFLFGAFTSPRRPSSVPETRTPPAAVDRSASSKCAYKNFITSLELLKCCSTILNPQHGGGSVAVFSPQMNPPFCVTRSIDILQIFICVAQYAFAIASETIATRNTVTRHALLATLANNTVRHISKVTVTDNGNSGKVLRVLGQILCAASYLHKSQCLYGKNATAHDPSVFSVCLGYIHTSTSLLSDARAADEFSEAVLYCQFFFDGLLDGVASVKEQYDKENSVVFFVKPVSAAKLPLVECDGSIEGTDVKPQSGKFHLPPRDGVSPFVTLKFPTGESLSNLCDEVETSMPHPTVPSERIKQDGPCLAPRFVSNNLLQRIKKEQSALRLDPHEDSPKKKKSRRK